ncbi:MAG: hypothetical protein KIS66_00575 [Fimbriimonadaceae bacterium]|nr:hypothetical protein [Fimbriimonadaceae bacterium]
MGTMLTLSLAFTLLGPNLAPTKPLMRDFIGLNVHTVLFKPDLYAPVARVLRNYHPVEWDLGQDPGQPTTFPMARNGVDWASLYGGWAKAGYTIHATLQVESVPATKWSDPAKQAFAYGRAFAETFGPSGKVPSIASVEIGNEPVEFDDATYRTVFESMAKGVHAGDPKLRILPCAVALGKEDKYARDIAALKGLEGLYDALNLHVYAFKELWPKWTRSFPEDPSIDYLKRVRAMIAWRNKNASGKPVWVTEFGWDASTQSPPGTGEGSGFVQNTDLEQARYLVRSLLVFSAMDVERAFVFFFNDDDAPSLHAASGITRKFVPKPSFHALAHLQQTLGDYRFHAKVAETPNQVYAYEYRAPGKDAVLAVWSPTGSERTAEVRLNIGKRKVVRAERMALRAGEPERVEAKVLSDGRVLMVAGESPIFLWVR